MVGIVLSFSFFLDKRRLKVAALVFSAVPILAFVDGLEHKYFGGVGQIGKITLTFLVIWSIVIGVLARSVIAAILLLVFWILEIGYGFFIGGKPWDYILAFTLTYVALPHLKLGRRLFEFVRNINLIAILVIIGITVLGGIRSRIYSLEPVALSCIALAMLWSFGNLVNKTEEKEVVALYVPFSLLIFTYPGAMTLFLGVILCFITILLFLEPFSLIKTAFRFSIYGICGVLIYFVGYFSATSSKLLGVPEILDLALAFILPPIFELLRPYLSKAWKKFWEI